MHLAPLGRVLNVNRSIYYKHYRNGRSNRDVENEGIRRCILVIYSQHSKRPGAYKMQHLLKREYGIRISAGRVHRLMKGMELPNMSTACRPKIGKEKKNDGPCENRLRPAGLIFHSDRGSEYTCKEFRDLLDRCSMLQFFSAKGYPYDNCVRESFFKYLKMEQTDRKRYHTREELRMDLFSFIDGYYNARRIHSYLGYKTPNEVEKDFLIKKS